MSDLLLTIGKNRHARKMIQGLGLPIPLPQSLERVKGPWEARPLEGRAVLVGAAPGGELEAVISKQLTEAGADGTPKHVWGLVFDATSIRDLASLRSLYDFFHLLVPRLALSGRVLVLGRPPERAASPEEASAQAALEGFTRSIAKEIGRRGATANLLYVEPGAEDAMAGPVRFLLSPRSAFVTTQPIRVSKPAKPAAAIWVRPLEGKIALVTGAGRGIGEATARTLAQEGARVVCVERPEDAALAETLAREIGGISLAVNVASPEAPAKIAQELKSRLGGVDIVVHNAGITRDKTLARMRAELWDQAIEVNLGAVLRITTALLESGTLRDGGRLICLSSVAGIAGNLGQTNYAASKAGVIGLVRHLKAQTASRGITVNAIAPGFIETRLTKAIPTMIREAGRRLSALGQGGQPVDVANLVTFLASPGSQGVSGQVIRVCGGALIGA